MTPNIKQRTGLANPIQFSPNYKLVQVAQKMGVRDLSKMQITTRQIYHALDVRQSTTPQTYTFFQNVNTSNFPFTNITDNKLQAGEALAVERAYLTILSINNTIVPGTEVITDVYPVEYDATTRPFLRSDFDLQIDRQTVTKKVSTTSWFAPFNKNAKFGNFLNTGGVNTYQYGQSVYHFDNSFIIIPQIEFTATITVPPMPSVSPTGLKVMLTVEGLGCLFNPKANY